LAAPKNKAFRALEKCDRIPSMSARPAFAAGGGPESERIAQPNTSAENAAAAK